MPMARIFRWQRLSRIAQLDQRTALPDQCLHSAEAGMRPPRRKSGFDPVTDIQCLCSSSRPDIGSQPFFKTIEHDNGILTVSREC
jgi:hypothetical protein